MANGDGIRDSRNNSGKTNGYHSYIKERYTGDFHQPDAAEELRRAYGSFARLARKLVKGEGLVQQNKNEIQRLLDATSVEMRNYIHGQNHTESDYVNLRLKIRRAFGTASDYDCCAKSNLTQYTIYQDKAIELNQKYGMNIPIFPFGLVDYNEKMKIDRLLKDARAGKPVKYEFPDYYDENELKSMGIEMPRSLSTDESSLEELKAQYRQFCHVARPLPKQIGLLPESKTELVKLVDETQKAMRDYLHSPNRTDADYVALQRKLRSACQRANDYERIAKKNLDFYGTYRKNIAELHDTYGIDIPVFPFDCCKSDEILKIDRLLKDAQSGKPVKYEFPDYYNESELNAIGIVTQRVDSIREVVDCIENERRYASASETVAHDISVAQMGDGWYSVQSTLPQTIATNNELDTRISNVGDVLQSRYPNGDISISFGGTTIPFDALRNIDAVDVDGNMIPVPDDLDALRSAVSKGWESDSQDMGTPINSFPSPSTRAAAPSVSARDRAKTIRNGMRKWEEAEEETVWVTAHFRGGTFINLYPRSRPHRNGNGNDNGNSKK